MPAVGFICPDKGRVLFEECFERCRLNSILPAGRCKALPFLRKASKQRKWTGNPSVTELLRGAREMWLKITKSYYVNPDDKTFLMLGTGVHAVLEKLASGDHLSEERLFDNICSGQFDFYDGESQTLYDYKTWGSYKIKDLNDPAKRASLLETSIQLSYYRDILKGHLPEGYDIKQIAVQVIARDSGTWISLSRGIMEKSPLIILHGVSPHWVQRYLKRKRELLFKALEDNYAPRCRKTETWHGRKCNGYCEVAEICSSIK